MTWDFEFDPEKSKRNRELHGLGLDTAEELWEGPHVVIQARDVKGEARFAIVGKLEGRVYVAIFTQRREAIRLISCHRADKRWERVYERYFEEKGSA